MIWYQNVSILDSLELRVMEVGLTTGAKDTQSSGQITTTNKSTPNVLQAGCPSCQLTNSIRKKTGIATNDTELHRKTSHRKLSREDVLMSTTSANRGNSCPVQATIMSVSQIHCYLFTVVKLVSNTDLLFMGQPDVSTIAVV